jgi:hypothetical protein
MSNEFIRQSRRTCTCMFYNHRCLSINHVGTIERIACMKSIDLISFVSNARSWSMCHRDIVSNEHIILNRFDLLRFICHRFDWSIFDRHRAIDFHCCQQNCACRSTIDCYANCVDLIDKNIWIRIEQIDSCLDFDRSNMFIIETVTM